MKQLVINFFILVSIVIVVLSSCTKKKHLLIETNNFTTTPTLLDTIYGIYTGIEVAGATNIYSGYGLLFVESNNPQQQLAVYDANSNKFIHALCLQGRAKNEFINPTNYCKQICKINDEIKIPVRNNGIEMKVVNVSKSLVEGRTVVEGVEDCIFQSKGCELYLSDFSKRFEYYRAWTNDARTGNYEIPRFYVKKERQMEIKVYGRLFEDKSIPVLPSIIYSGGMRIKPDETKAVFYNVHMNYLFVFDLEKKKAFAIHKTDELSFEESLPEDLSTLRLGYGDVCLTNKYIIALAPNGTEDDYDDDIIMPQLMVFDWDGNYLFGWTFDRRIYNISIDEYSKRLFGFERLSEKIYVYDLPSLFI